MRRTPLLVLSLWLTACGGSGGSGGFVDPGNQGSGGSNLSQSTLYEDLDAALLQRSVSTTDPKGLWMVYAEGTVNSQFSQGGDTFASVTAVHLYAFLMSVYLIDDVGTLRMEINDCSGAYNGNAALAGALQGAASLAQVSLTLQKIEQMAGTLNPFRAGDTIASNSANYSTYRNTPVDVTIVDNREMQFPMDFAFQDTDGDFQGEFTASFKARKISDDIFGTLGEFTVNAANRESHCLEYINMTEVQTNTTNFQGQTSVMENTIDQERVIVQSWRDSTDGISSMLYQFSDAHDATVNGQPVPGSEVLAVSMTNTGNLFDNMSVTTALPTDLVDATLTFTVDSGLGIDYSISDDASVTTLTGTIQAAY